MNKTKVVLCIIDSVDWRWINKENTPFIHRLVTENYHARINSLPGFSATIYACLWPSLYPKDHGIWCHFWRKSGDYHPNPWLGRLYSLVPYSVYKPFKLAFNLYQSEIRHSDRGFFMFVPLNEVGYYEEITYDFKKKPVPLGKYPTIYQVAGEDKTRWAFYTSMDRWLKGSQIPVDEMQSFDCHFLGDIDYYAHHMKHDSDEFADKLRMADWGLERIYQSYREKWRDSFHFIFMSDHGQEPIRKYVDIKRILRQAKLKVRRDYLAFYDSTFVRFWVKSDSVTDALREILQPYEGHFLSLEEKRGCHIHFDDNRFGDEVFLLEPGNLVFPNYHQAILNKERHKGMHGYHPDHISMKGIFTIKGSVNSTLEDIEVVDIVPSILSLLGIEPPGYMRGKIIWDR